MKEPVDLVATEMDIEAKARELADFARDATIFWHHRKPDVFFINPQNEVEGAVAAALREARETALRDAAAVADAFWRDEPWKQIGRAVSISDAILALLAPAETETPDAS